MRTFSPSPDVKSFNFLSSEIDLDFLNVLDFEFDLDLFASDFEVDAIGFLDLELDLDLLADLDLWSDSSFSDVLDLWVGLGLLDLELDLDRFALLDSSVFVFLDLEEDLDLLDFLDLEFDLLLLDLDPDLLTSESRRFDAFESPVFLDEESLESLFICLELLE